MNRLAELPARLLLFMQSMRDHQSGLFGLSYLRMERHVAASSLVCLPVHMAAAGDTGTIQVSKCLRSERREEDRPPVTRPAPPPTPPVGAPGSANLMWPFWPPMLIAGLLMVMVLSTLGNNPPLPHLAVILVCCLAGGTTWAAMRLYWELSDEIKHSHALYPHRQEHIDRIHEFLIDNPELAGIEQVRRALLPTDPELKLFNFSPSYCDHLREMRENPNPRRAIRTGGGPSLQISDLCLRPVGHGEAGETADQENPDQGVSS